jgi:glycosyltransferase involved in cell wall biosynthesis
MRVCLMNDNFYRSSGAAIAIRRIYQAAAADVEYFVVGCSDGGLIEDLSWVPAERFVRFNLKTSNPVRVFSELRRFKRWFKAQGCDLAHSHHRRVAALLQAAGLPVLYTGQLAFPFALWFRWLRPHRTTAVSPSVASNLLETTGRETLACIGNPAEFPEAPPHLELDEVRCKAVCIARLEAIKGHGHLLAAWKLLAQRGYRYELELVGEGSLRQELEAQVRKDGLQDLIRFRGFTTDVSDAIANCLFAVLVSEREGQGIVTLEAAAMGRASLLTAVPGSIDLLPPNRRLRNGLAFGNVTELADVLEEWFTHPSEVLEEGERFFHFLKNTSDPQQIAAEYRGVYQQILANSPSSSSPSKPILTSEP